MRIFSLRRAGAGLLFLAGVVVLALSAQTEPANDFHFSIVGDRTGGARAGVYEQAWREMSLLGPDFVINVGDTIEGGKDETAEAEWREMRRLLDRYAHIRLFLIPGNHDIWSTRSEEIFAAQTGRPAYYSFDHQNAHFTVLDNSRTLDLSESQLEFLENDLKAHAHRHPKFVFFHKPFWLLPVRLKSSRFPLHEIAQRYGAGFVISGHGHQLFRGVRDGVTYLEVGSSGANIDKRIAQEGAFAQGYFYHHAWVRVKGASVDIAIKELSPPFGEGRFFPAAEWDERGPQFDVAGAAAEVR